MLSTVVNRNIKLSGNVKPAENLQRIVEALGARNNRRLSIYSVCTADGDDRHSDISDCVLRILGSVGNAADRLLELLGDNQPEGYHAEYISNGELEAYEEKNVYTFHEQVVYY